MLPHLFSQALTGSSVLLLFEWHVFLQSDTRHWFALGKQSHLAKTRAEVHVRGCQCPAGGHSSFLQSWPRATAPCSSQPLFPVLLGWLLAVTESTLCFGCLCCYWHSQSAGRKRKEIAHQCNGGRLWWERRACLDCRTLTAGSRKEGSHCDVASKCTKRIGTVLTRYCYTVNWLKKKPENQ